MATGNEGDRIHGPQEFSAPAWGKIGAIGGAQLTPGRAEIIIIPAGTVDTVVVGWYSGDWNEIWLVDDFPYPVKALTYTWITTGIPPILHQYTLLDYKENVKVDPFKDDVEKRQVEGYISRARQWIRYSATSDMPLNCFGIAEGLLKEAEKFLRNPKKIIPEVLK